ncbi:MAG: NAD-dependent epimerase/dehydratase family protein [bacterium]
MRALITGTAGFIGSNLAMSLVNQNWEVRGLILEEENPAFLKEVGVDIRRGDLTKKETLKALAKDIDVVFHIAAQLGKASVSYQRTYEINVNGTINLILECLNSNIQHFIYCSSRGVGGVKETDPYSPDKNSAYELTKCEAEKATLEYSYKEGLPLTIIRPCFVYGPRDLHKLELFQSIQRKRFLLVGDGSAFWHPTFIEDLLQGFLLAVNKPPKGEIYNIGGPDKVSILECLTTIAQELDVSIPRLRVPVSIAYVSAFGCEWFSNLTNKEPFISRSKVRRLTTDDDMDISKAKRELGYKPQFDFKEGVKRTVKWYKENGFL